MLSFLERRFDNVIFRMGIGASRKQCRQIINHGHVSVNGNKVDIASYQVNVGDEISIKENKRDLEMFKELQGMKIVMPDWLEFDSENLKGKILSLPTRKDIDLDIKERLIIELYSK